MGDSFVGFACAQESEGVVQLFRDRRWGRGEGLFEIGYGFGGGGGVFVERFAQVAGLF